LRCKYGKDQAITRERNIQKKGFFRHEVFFRYFSLNT